MYSAVLGDCRGGGRGQLQRFLLVVTCSWVCFVVTAQPDGESLCSAELSATCIAQACCANINNNDNPARLPLDYNCSLPGLESFTPGQYNGIQVNYLSFVTQTSSPNVPVRAREFEACTGASIVFSEAENIWEDPVRE